VSVGDVPAPLNQVSSNFRSRLLHVVSRCTNFYCSWLA